MDLNIQEEILGRLRRIRLGETAGDSRDGERPVVTLETGGDQLRLYRLVETSGDWGRPVETLETGGD